MKYKKPIIYYCLQCPECLMTEFQSASEDGMSERDEWKYLTDEEDGTEFVRCVCGCEFLEEYQETINTSKGVR